MWDGRAWLAAPPPAPAPVISPPLEFHFPVGNAEKHTVRFHLEQSNQQLTIDVDGTFIVNETQQFSLSMTKTYNFTVGTTEPHAVIIEKRREMLATGAKPYSFRVWIDGVYYGALTGDTWTQQTPA